MVDVKIIFLVWVIGLKLLNDICQNCVPIPNMNFLLYLIILSSSVVRNIPHVKSEEYYGSPESPLSKMDLMTVGL